MLACLLIIPAIGGHIPVYIISNGTGSAQPDRTRSNLEANLPQIPQRPQYGRHDGGLRAKESFLVGELQRREVGLPKAGLQLLLLKVV